MDHDSALIHVSGILAGRVDRRGQELDGRDAGLGAGGSRSIPTGTGICRPNCCQGTENPVIFHPLPCKIEENHPFRSH